MNKYKSDLHIHSVLSPCGDLEMSPTQIIAKAKELGLDMIGLTDHNSTRQSKLTKEIGEKNGIFVLRGAEVTTQEEIHCLAFFEKDEELDIFQAYLEKHLSFVENDPDKFGYQLVVDEEENVLDMEDSLLISALNQSMDEVYEKVKSLNGIFIPAHINKKSTSVMSQLGFVPPDIKADALEITRHITKEDFIKKNAYLKNFTFIQSSDAHYIHLIGETYSVFHMKELSFDEFRKTLKREDGRFVELNP